MLSQWLQILVSFIKQIMLKAPDSQISRNSFSRRWVEAQKQIQTLCYRYKECDSEKDTYMYVLLNSDQVEDLKKLKIKTWFWFS